MIRLIIAVLPPNAQATRSNEKSPTRPQFKAPIITRIKQILSNIISTPFVNISFTKKGEIYKKATILKKIVAFKFKMALKFGCS